MWAAGQFFSEGQLYDAETFRWVVSGLAGLLVSVALWQMKRIIDEAQATRMMLYDFIESVTMVLVDLNPDKATLILGRLGTIKRFRLRADRIRMEHRQPDGD